MKTLSEKQMQKIRLAPYRFARTGMPFRTAAYFANEVFAQWDRFPDYWIGNYGTIFSVKYGMKVMPTVIHGYLKVTMQNAIGEWETIGIHRAVMMAHCPISNPNKMQVHHITHNPFYNVYLPNDPRNGLMWVTPQEHTNLAYEEYGDSYGSQNKGIQTFVSDDQARIICQALSDGYSPSEALVLAGLPKTPDMHKMVYKIRVRQAFAYISKDYPNTPWPKKRGSLHSIDPVT